MKYTFNNMEVYATSKSTEAWISNDIYEVGDRTYNGRYKCIDKDDNVVWIDKVNLKEPYAVEYTEKKETVSNVVRILPEMNIPPLKLIHVEEKVVEETKPEKDDSVYHIVGWGDTVQSIAFQYNVSTDDILAQTGGKKPSLGQKIKVR